MSGFLYAEINAIGIAILLLLLSNIKKSGLRGRPLDQRIFNSVMLMNIVVFLFDTGMWLTDGNPHPMAITLNYLSTTLYYISNPLICFVWLMYTDFKIHESRSGLRKRSRLYIIPAAVSGIMSLLSPFTKWMFIIGEDGSYHRGPLFLIMSFAALVYIVLSCAISLNDIYKNGWDENKSVSLHLVVFPIVIIIAATIQILFFGVSIIWVCSMLAFASIYINIQNGEISTDHLTGLYNRRRLDRHLQRKLKAGREDRLLFAVMLDLDDFKKVNDRYGHIAGDNALVKTAELLRQACKGSDDFIARMGGDEFIIVGERIQAREVDWLIDDVYALAEKHNKSHPANYALWPSMGYSIFEKGETADAFLAAADREMYRNKEQRKFARSKESAPA